MDVSDEEVPDKNGCLSGSMTTTATNTIMTERIWIIFVASEILFQPMYSDTGAPLHEERVITVRKKPNLHLELCQQDVTCGMRTPDRVCQHVAPRVPFTPETKDPINEGLLMKMPKAATLINAVRPKREHEARDT